MAKTRKEHLEDQQKLEESWRAVHNLCAGFEGMLDLRDALVVALEESKTRIERLAELDKLIESAQTEVGRLSDQKKKLDVDVKKAGERVEQTERQAHDKVRAELDKDLAGVKTALDAARSELRAFEESAAIKKVELNRDFDTRKAEFNSALVELSKDAANKRRELDQVTQQLRALRSGIPAA
jgi:chromosome segregation ATPase